MREAHDAVLKGMLPINGLNDFQQRDILGSSG
jgi:hypothetical protein